MPCTVSLSNVTQDGDGVDDIAWDAVAFEPLDSKPNDFVVALGDSYSSGEGASEPDGSNYYLESDHHGTKTVDGEDSRFRNACHRSAEAWSLKASLPGNSQSIGEDFNSRASDLDYHLLACSGAEAMNLLPFSTATETKPTDYAGNEGRGQFGEVSQLDRGFVDENTTLVTLSIGGNDARFGEVLKACMTARWTNRDCGAMELEYDGGVFIKQATMNRVAVDVPASVQTVLKQIRAKAPTAVVLLMGYPQIFETGADCVQIHDEEMAWLNGISDQLNDALRDSALAQSTVDAPVVFGDPTAAFSGHNLCTENSAINGLQFELTPGDKPMITIPVPGPNFGLGVSMQSVHPNKFGTDLYARVMESTLTGVYP